MAKKAVGTTRLEAFWFDVELGQPELDKLVQWVRTTDRHLVLGMCEVVDLRVTKWIDRLRKGTILGPPVQVEGLEFPNKARNRQLFSVYWRNHVGRAISVERYWCEYEEATRTLGRNLPKDVAVYEVSFKILNQE